MKLHLADGTVAQGQSFGAARDVQGEVVFNTGMSGYVESLTDPSYRGQILLLTYPLQGNYGVPDGGFESDRIQIEGLIVGRHAEYPSHHASQKRLGEWLKASGVPALEGVDTRALTRHLRSHGTMQGHLFIDDSSHPETSCATQIDLTHVAAAVTQRQIVRYPGGDLRVLVIDTGAKENIIRALQTRGATVIRVPFFEKWEAALDDVDGVVLTNGPGDPSHLGELTLRLQVLLARSIPTFGICLGHQLLALAAGGRTYKLKYGHRSLNQPVVDLATGRAFVTSQNHGFAVEENSLPPDWEPWFANLNDNTNEGLRHRYRPLRSVQFHPEAAPGPHDTAFLFDDFLRTVGEMKRSRK